VTLGTWVAATEGAPPQDTSPPASAAKQAPPAPPGEYVKAGLSLCQTGDYVRAKQYLKAAEMYRDQLTPEEQSSLDSAQQLVASGDPTSSDAAPSTTTLAEAPTAASNAEEASADASLHDSAAALVAQAREAMSINRRDEARTLAQQAEAMGASFAAGEDSPARVLAELSGVPTGPATRGPGGGDTKQQAEWLLHQSREMISLGNFDEAAKKLAEARAMNVRWGLFDDTPTKVAKDLERYRPKSNPNTAAAPATAHTGTRDRREAKEKLKEARRMIDAGQVDQAEAIAVEVGTWGVRFGMFDDNPAKVASAARAVKRRELGRHGDHGVSKDLYQMQVAEARDLLKKGALDEAEMKARYAQRLNVVPGLSDDRAEAVIHDVAIARQNAVNPAAANLAATTAPAANDPAIQQVNAGQEAMPGNAQAPADDLYGPAPTAVNDPLAEIPGMERDPAAPAAETSPTPVEVPQAVAATEAAPLQDAPLELAAVDPTATADAPADAPVLDAPAQVREEAPLAVEPEPVPAPEAELTETPVPAEQPEQNPGEVILSQARDLMVAGNYSAARKRATEAQMSQTGVEAPAEELLSQIALAEQAGALKLYDAALVAVREQQNDRARALLNEIATSEIQDENIKQKVEDLLVRLPGDKAGRASTLVTMEDAETVNAQKFNAEVGAAAAEARHLMETDPDKAIAHLEKTLKAVKAAGLNESATRTMTRRLEVAIELAKKDKVAFDTKMQDKQYRAEIEQKRLRILEADNAKLARVKDLFEKSKEAEAAGDLMKAEQLAKQIIEIDPNNVAAVAQSTMMRVRRRYARDKEILAAKDEGAVIAFQQVDASGIADPDAQIRGISMPKDFGDLTRNRRDMAERLKIKKDPKTLEIERRLNEPISVNFDDTPLSEAIDYIAQMTGINVVLDSTALAEEGIAPTTPIKLTIKDTKLKSVLKLLLRQMHLTYDVTDDVLLITNTQSSKERMVTLAYPVADLVISPISGNKNPSANPNMSPTDPRGNGGQDAQFNPAGLLNGGTGPNSPQTDDGFTPYTGLPSAATIKDPKPDFGPLIDMIKVSIAPGTWKESGDGNGGGYGLGAGFAGGGADDAPEPVGSITPFFLNISLIIRHTSEVHDDVVDLLRQLRRLQDLQVSIEVRFITVSDSFFEQIGVDFDFSIQSDAVGKHSSFATLNPAASLGSQTGTTGGTGTGGGTGTTTTVAPYLINPARDHALGGQQPLIVGRNGNGDTGNFTSDLQMPFLQSSAGAITPFNALSSNTGATFGLAFLSDLEVYLFLTAAQGDVRSNLV
jgi:hypothetical protein